MTYATHEDIQARLRHVTFTPEDATDASTVTVEDLQGSIQTVDGEINTALASVDIVTPATIQAAGRDYLEWLKRVTIQGVLAEQLPNIFPTGGGPSWDPTLWYDRYQDSLKLIRDRKMIPNAIPQTSSDGASSLFTRYPRGEGIPDGGPLAEPKFNMYEEF